MFHGPTYFSFQIMLRQSLLESSGLSRLSRSTSLVSSHMEEDEDVLRDGKCQTCVPTKGVLKEIKETWRLSWALIVITLTNYSMQPVAQMFAGHLGKVELDALALANSMINILGWASLQGYGSVCDTVFSQTFGSKNHKYMGVYLQRCLILHFFLVTILLIIFFNMEYILLLAGQNAEVAHVASHYLLMFSPSVVAMSLYFILREYIYTQDIIYPDLFISISAFGLHVILQYVIIQHSPWGLTGSALGQVAINFYMAIATFMYLILSGLYKKTWDGWSRACLEEWGVMLKLAVYGLLLTCFEWWAFEVTIILSGILGTTQLAAQSIVFNIDIIVYSLAGGFGVATSIRVGWYLGAGKPASAKTSSSAGILLSFISSTFIFILIIATHNQLPKLFTNDVDIIKLSSNLLPFIAAYTFFDGISGICRSVIRGTGMQFIGTVVVFVCYYCIALPVGIPVMFLTSWELYGVWLSLVFALALGSGVYCFVIYYIFDWNKLSHDAQTRSGILEKIVPSTEDKETSHLLEYEPIIQNNSIESNQESDTLIEQATLSRSFIILRCLIILFFVVIFVTSVSVKLCFTYIYNDNGFNMTDIYINNV